MPTGKITKSIVVGGINMLAVATETDTGLISHEVELSAGKSGTLSTRTDNDTGVCTIGTSHGITDADVVDVMWTGGARYGMTVTGYDGTTITVDAGAGDNFPLVSSAIVVSVQTVIDTDFDGDLMSMLVATCTTRVHLDFQENDGTSLYAVDIAAGDACEWTESSGVTVPITGDPVGQICVGNGAASAGTLKIAVLYDSEE
jgi:hypothetical protein